MTAPRSRARRSSPTPRGRSTCTTRTSGREAIAAPPGKRTVTFEIPVATPAGVELRTYTDLDTSRGAYRHEDLALPFEDEFTTIGTAALEAGIGTRGTVGAATCHLFPAADLVRFGVAWVDRHFI